MIMCDDSARNVCDDCVCNSVCMQRLVAQNKEKYAAALAEFDDLDSPEATKLRQKLFREDWQKQMEQDAQARAAGAF